MEDIMSAEQEKAYQAAMKAPVAISLAEAKHSVDLSIKQFNDNCFEDKEDAKHMGNAVKARQFADAVERLPSDGSPALKVRVERRNGKSETWLYTGLRVNQPAGKRFRIERA